VLRFGQPCMLSAYSAAAAPPPVFQESVPVKGKSKSIYIASTLFAVPRSY